MNFSWDFAQVRKIKKKEIKKSSFMDQHEDLKLLLLQFLIKQSEDTVNFLAKVEGDILELHLSGLNLGQVQNIVDERTGRRTNKDPHILLAKSHGNSHNAQFKASCYHNY
jgi:hypothetical protein